MGVRARAAIAVASVAVGVLAPTGHAAPQRATKLRPTVVVAVADTGVNPYHEVFHRPKNTAHPCTWVKGFTDCSVPALNLSIGKYRSVEEAYAADRAVWDSVKQHTWYWIPRTNIIGAVCDQPVGGGASSEALPPDGNVACILDESNHGTATASAVLTEAPDALLLIHEGSSLAADLPTAPVIPDVQSHSWGNLLVVAPAPLQALRPIEDVCPSGQAHRETLFFLAAGNEAPAPSQLDCQRYAPEIQVVGGGFPGYWQANSWTMYDFASWYCRAGAAHDSVNATVGHCGTSFSTPTVAGTAAAALLRIRRHDGYVGRNTVDRMSTSVTREEFVNALRNAASYTPAAKFPDYMPCVGTAACVLRGARFGWAPLPEQAPWLIWGYGWLDSTVTDAVVACALRRTCPAKSAEARAFNAQRQEVRAASGLPALAPHAPNDAGTGRDAGEDGKTAIRIAPGIAYDGRVERIEDTRDVYSFRGVAGQRLTVTSVATMHAALPTPPPPASGCWVLHGPDGERLTAPSAGNVLSCDVGREPPTDQQLPTTGTYLLEFSSNSTLPQDYRFSFRLDR